MMSKHDLRKSTVPRACRYCSRLCTSHIEHYSYCYFALKCLECGGRVDLGKSMHAYKCSHTVKCSQCKSRMDQFDSEHLFDCPLNPFLKK